MDRPKIGYGIVAIMICVFVANYIYIGTVRNVPSVGSIVDERSDEKSKFVEILNQEIVPDLWYDVNSVLEWRVEDLNYLMKEEWWDLEREIDVLREALEQTLIPDIHTEEGTRIWGYSKVEWRDTLISAINMRQQLLEGGSPNYYGEKAYIGRQEYIIYDKMCHENPYEQEEKGLIHRSTLPIKQDTQMIAAALYEVLYVYEVPEPLITNLEVYISPYYFDGKLGFASTGLLVGRDEEIVLGIPASYQTTENDIIKTILHELGHVFDYDMLGMSEVINDQVYVSDWQTWGEIEELHIKNGVDNPSDMRESIAEHVYYYLATCNEIPIRVEYYQIYPEIVEYIEEMFRVYDPYTEYVVPSIKVNNYTLIGNGRNSPIKERFEQGMIRIGSDIKGIRGESILMELYRLEEKQEEQQWLLPIVTSYDFSEGEFVRVLDEGEYMLVLRLREEAIGIYEFYIR